MAEYRFEDIAINSTEKKKPVESDKEHYLGLEHLDSGTFKVSRFGSEVAPIGDKLIMKKGDVLFGKRRAYQKKVAIAPFDGIFSAHGMVLRPKEDVIDKNFFPLFIASDYFLDAAIKISVGSLSPTINWRDLKELKFNLPELDEQKKLAEVLWQIVDTIESYKKLLAKTDEMIKAKFVEMFGSIDNSKWMYKRLGELCKISSGYAFKSDRFQNKGVPVLRIGNINSGVLKKDNLVFWPDDTSLSKYILYPGDLAMSLTGTVGKDDYGNICILNDEYPKYYLNQRNAKFSDFNDNLNKLYLAYYFKLPLVKKTLTNSNHGVRQANILNKDLENILLPLPPITLQNEYVNFVRKSEESKVAIQTSLNSLKQVYKKIITENLGGSN